jgi:hypothetical protein
MVGRACGRTESPGPAAELAVAQAAVDANMQTDSGKQFDSVVTKAFATHYSDIVRMCVKEAQGNLGSFDLLIQLGGNGLMQRVFATPQTPVGSCLVRMLSTRMLAEPPKPLYWIKISMEFNQ